MSDKKIQSSKKMVAGISVIFAANVLSMILNGGLSFVLPKYLSINSYGTLKTFQLFLSYIGITSVGFVDGVYLRYGGKTIDTIEKTELNKCHATYRMLNMLYTIFVFAIALIWKNAMLALIAVIFIPYNVSNYYRTFFQAIGEFKRYAQILALIPIITAVLDLAALFILRTDNPIIYISIVVITNYIIYVYLEIINTRSIPSCKLFAFDLQIFLGNAKRGITLLLSNFTSVLLTSMDRLFVKFYLASQYFSFYSFAVTIENMFNTCTAPITVTLYNYYCTEDNINNHEKIKRVNIYCSIAVAYLISVAFGCKYIISRFLENYIESISVVFILLAAHVFYFVIKAVYVNYQKACGEQNLYFTHMIIILAFGTFSNYVASKILCNVNGFAIATFCAAAVWYVLNIFRYRNSIVSFRAVLFQIVSVFMLFIIEAYTGAIIGFALYIVAISISALIILKNDYMDLMRLCVRLVCEDKRCKEGDEV